MKKPVFFVTVVSLLVATAMTSWSLATSDEPNYREIPPDVLARIEESDQAFMQKDLDTIAGHLAEDFSWYMIGADGPKQMVSGRANTLERLSAFFAGDSGWTDAEVYRLGGLGNIFVQVEVDHFDTPEGPKTVRTLTVYEMKGDKRWREWKFYPVESDSAS